MICVLVKNLPWRKIGNEPIRISFWFDGKVFHPLMETLDRFGEPTSGKLLASKAKLVQACNHAREWIENNLDDMSKRNGLISQWFQ